MKTNCLLLLILLPMQSIVALHIAQVRITAFSETEISISLNTEAEELYYFQSWQYAISGNTIVLEALFIPGFGSTIAYLNTNFQIPLNTINEAEHHLIVKVYYTSYESHNLQESVEGFFTTPLFKSIVLDKNCFPMPNNPDLVFVNPCTNGEIAVHPEIKRIWIFDGLGKCIQEAIGIQGEIKLLNYPDGIYILAYIKQNQFKIARIILKNQ